jgi:hypothetical protein
MWLLVRAWNIREHIWEVKKIRDHNIFVIYCFYLYKKQWEIKKREEKFTRRTGRGNGRVKRNWKGTRRREHWK